MDNSGGRLSIGPAVPLLRRAKGQLDFIDHALVPILTTAISTRVGTGSRRHQVARRAFLLSGTVAVLVPWSICAIATKKAHMRSRQANRQMNP
jgi:hypothetical protein